MRLIIRFVQITIYVHSNLYESESKYVFKSQIILFLVFIYIADVKSAKIIFFC